MGANAEARDQEPARPRVSVVMPCRDEERHIGAALGSLLDGSFPAEQMEVLVVDGNSGDRTREIVAEVARRDRRVRLLFNPRAVTPAALNIGVRAARGDIIARVDAHTVYPPDYVAVLVRALEETGADLVGCGEEAVPPGEGVWAEVLTLALRGVFATASPYRYRRRAGAVDTVPFGCWRREVFARVGGFDERLLRNQDYEHARRLGRAGGRIHLITDTRVRYIPRASLRRLWRQAIDTGMWNAFMHRLCPYTFRWRHFLPGPFFLAVVTALLLLAALPLGGDRRLALAGAALLGAYLALDLAAAVVQAARRGRPWLAPLLAFTVASHHVVYGYGICKGWALIAAGRWRSRIGREGES